MAISAEQVADLRIGDVVRLNGASSMNGATIEGPLYDKAGALAVGTGFEVRQADGSPPAAQALVLAIVSRAPRPPYSNHARTEFVNGDVARGPQGGLWFRIGGGWRGSNGLTREWVPGIQLTLLVDGETGQVVT